MNQQVSCIIPFYNEDSRILNVLKTVTKIKVIDEIICVDDGSSDNASEIIKKNYPSIQLIKHPVNKGKVTAVKTGALVSKYDNILLLDADLIGLDQKEISQAIKIFVSQPNLDLLILYKKNDHFISRILRWNVVIGGDRLIKKTSLLKILNTNIKRYQLEVSMNKFAITHKLKTKAIPVSHKYYFMTSKYGPVKGMWGELKLIWNMFSYISIWEFIYQIIFFCKTKV